MNHSIYFPKKKWPTQWFQRQWSGQRFTLSFSISKIWFISFPESASSTFIYIRKFLLKLTHSGNWAILTSILSDLITFLRWIFYIRLLFDEKLFISLSMISWSISPNPDELEITFSPSGMLLTLLIKIDFFLENFSNESNTEHSNFRTF